MPATDYSINLKRDLLHLVTQHQLPCCRQAFLIGLCRGPRRRPFVKTRISLKRLLLGYLQKGPGGTDSVRSVKGRILIRKTDQLVLRQKFVDRIGRCNEASSVKHCQIAFLQGLFFSRGYIQNPGQGYHLEYRLRGRWLISAFKKITGNLKVRFAQYQNGSDRCFYLKSGRRIIRLLNLLGLFEKSLELSDLTATRSILSMVNRQVNFETANINRLIDAAEEAIGQIHDLLSYHDQEIWSENLRQLSLVRLKFPHDSLEALGKRFDPPLSKSAVNHRLRRIKNLHARFFPGQPEITLPEDDD